MRERVDRRGGAEAAVLDIKNANVHWRGSVEWTDAMGRYARQLWGALRGQHADPSKRYPAALHRGLSYTPQIGRCPPLRHRVHHRT